MTGPGVVERSHPADVARHRVVGHAVEREEAIEVGDGRALLERRARRAGGDAHGEHVAVATDAQLEILDRGPHGAIIAPGPARVSGESTCA